MNCFEYAVARLSKDETFVNNDKNIKIYDANEKTEFEDGDLVLTTHRIFWGKTEDIANAHITLCLPLKYVLTISNEYTGNLFFGRKLRLILHLAQPPIDKPPGHEAIRSSNGSFIKFSGKNGIKPEFAEALRETVRARIWEIQSVNSNNGQDDSINNESSKRMQENGFKSTAAASLRMRTGIGGIEKAIETKIKETDENIALAFQDLKILMGMAKDMVQISTNISEKIRMQKGEISDDETIRFKSYLLSLGISDPVTRDNYSSDTLYFRNLAKQLCEMLLDPLEECDGMMSLADVYCRVNRARGLELLSPEDLLQACRLMDGPIKMRTFPSGAIVLQLESHSDALIISDTLEITKNSISLTVEELAKKRNISLLLAKEHLLAAERLGLICRDESLCGLRFYPNLILNKISKDE